MKALKVGIIFLLLAHAHFSQGQEQSPHGDKGPADCKSCHIAGDWWTLVDPLPFDHDTTSFALEGAHQSVSCMTCHNSLTFSEASGNLCVDCHTDVHSGTVGQDCSDCHSPESWLVHNIPEIHEMNGFALIGPHSALNCIDCHDNEVNLRFDRLGNECISCHESDFQATQSPNHAVSGFSTDCLECHDALMFGWQTEFVDHSFFPLVGGHDIQNCSECHTSNNFQGLSTNCYDCHQTDYVTAANPIHSSPEFSMDCTECHTIDNWEDTQFDHSQYPLIGAHQLVDCNSCHNGDYTSTPTDCIGCHENDFNSAQNPDHITSGFPQDCLICHDENGWTPSSFDHSEFPIVGAHQALDCTQCHTEVYAGTPDTCIGCHEDTYTQTINPDHQAAFFSTECLECHDETMWVPSTYSHVQYPLTGAHVVVDCNSCHADGYLNTPSDCINCHREDYEMARDPDHSSSLFPNDCTICHDNNAWEPAEFDHSFYPLDGAHARVDCIDCHNGNYTNTPTDCIDCHQSDFNTSTNPDHSDAQFSTDCTECHDENAWVPSSYDHNQYPLVGEHQAVDCSSCHSEGYFNTGNDCVDCHNDDFLNTTNPDHQMAGFPTDCILCHTESGWIPSDFDHSEFPLLGAHQAVDCNDCHNGNYTNTPNECIDCHTDDYQNSINPDHATANFSTDCTECHDETAWVPSNLDHDGLYFPIFNGNHARGVWNLCTECHIDLSNYATFSCIDCHEHSNKNEVDDDHADVPDYMYVSTACLDCHPDGNE